MMYAFVGLKTKLESTLSKFGFFLIPSYVFLGSCRIVVSVAVGYVYHKILRSGLLSSEASFVLFIFNICFSVLFFFFVVLVSTTGKVHLIFPGSEKKKST